MANGSRRRARLTLSRYTYKVQQPDGCWLWVGAVATTGYGVLSERGRRAYAHRVSYELHVGSIPDGMELDHLCRVRECVNPEHLEVVTHGENIRRWWATR